MDFRLTEEQLAFQREARRYLQDHYPPERVAQLADAPQGWDPGSWQELASMGWLGIDVPESHRGAGLGFCDVAVILEELGYAMYPGPYFSSIVLAGGALSLEERALVADGSVRWSAEVDGLVPDLALVDRVVTPRGAVDGVGITLDTTDATRRLGRLRADLETKPVSALDKTRANAGLAAEAVGVAQRALDLAVQHAQLRSQFGRPIGCFQAVSHSLADCHVQIELSRSLAYWAAWRIDEQPDRAAMAAAAAKSHASETAVEVCESSIQVFGGLGFTWDHHLHRLYKRALAIRSFLGAPAVQRELIAEGVIDTPDRDPVMELS